jgi:hypothetical protein
MTRALYTLSTGSPRALHGSDTPRVHGPSTGKHSAGGVTHDRMNTNREARPKHISEALARALEAIRKAEG